MEKREILKFGKIFVFSGKIMNMNKIFLLSLSLFSSIAIYAQRNGGMWIPTELNETEMKELGMKISAKDIFNPNQPSIKDAVVHFNGGCTAEVISPKGLLLTNHHCGYRQIQSHSTVENDLLSNGFWAQNETEELPNPGMVVDFIVDIQEVSDRILPGTENLTPQEAQAAIQRNIEEAKKSFKLTPDQKIAIRSMYDGNKYYAFIIETFKDIRLVGAPPQSIGKFGSDTDNWVWPRHVGDFSLFRIYANKKNNQPAEYSPENVPYKPKYYLPISVRDLKEDDFTFVFGFPGKTEEYLPSIAVQKIVEDIDPARISVRNVALNILDEKMRADDATRIKYASKYASIANYRKKWQGEVEGLTKSKAVQKKQAYENSLAAKNPEIKTTISTFNRLYNEQAPYALNAAYYSEVMGNAETLRLANFYINYVRSAESGNRDSKYLENLKSYLKDFYKNYDADIDAKVTAHLLSLFAEKSPEEFLPSGFSKFKNVEENLKTISEWSKNSIITGGKDLNGANVNKDIDQFFNEYQLVATLKEDPFYQLALSMKEVYTQKVEPQNRNLQLEINALQKKYMKQQMYTDKEKQFFPDANSTLRVTYGVVKGSNPRDAVEYDYQTHLSGVIEKYIPGDYEFDVPQRLLDLYQAKDYGIYKDATGEVPVNFTATNHTTGGNSGSPVIDAYGNLIGLNFDRQWEGTMSDINYDPELCRNIMVNTQYILFVIDKYANAKWLLDEMKIVKD